MKGSQVVKTIPDFLALVQRISKYDFKKPLEISWRPEVKVRTLSMNSLSHVWYADVAKITFETEEEVKRFCKLHFGVPILRAEDEKFRRLYDSAIYKIYTYEEKLEAMDLLPVTSRMDSNQMSRYLTNMQRTYSEQGIVLESKGEYAEMLAQEANNRLSGKQ